MHQKANPKATGDTAGRGGTGFGTHSVPGFNMKFKRSEKPWPRSWTGFSPVKPILEKDLRFTRGGLALKLLVFRNRRDLYRFWSRAEPTCLGGLTPDAAGACSSFSSIVDPCNGKPVYSEVDGRYFAAMGLCAGHLGMEIVTHESVHAGFAYARRKGKKPWDTGFDDLDEENVCYPAGAVARMVVKTLDEAGLYGNGVSLRDER